MMNIKDFQKFSEDLAYKFNLKVEKLHEQLFSLHAFPNPDEIIRIALTSNYVGIAFQVDLIAQDAIQIFENAKLMVPEVELLESYYINEKNEVFHGMDAKIMVENDRENKYLKILENRTKAVELTDLEIKRLEKNGKVTFH